MTGWTAVLAACAVAYGLKVTGYLAPAHWLSRPGVARAATLVTAGLLGALLLVQTVADGSRLTVDARVGALAAAVVALWLRAPFIVVVLVGALSAAGLRVLGIG